MAKFYRCPTCGKTLLVIKGISAPACCGEPMELLEAGAVDAATEKHVPVVTRTDTGIDVNVGSVDHPMLEAHYIQWIALVDGARTEIHTLEPEAAPKTSFVGPISDGAEVFEYCNLHGLWKATV